MADTMNSLYAYLLRSRMGEVWNDPEYQAFCRCAAYREGQLRARLDKGGEQLLDDMLSELSSRHAVEQEVMFQSTATLCRELRGALG